LSIPSYRGNLRISECHSCLTSLTSDDRASDLPLSRPLEQQFGTLGAEGLDDAESKTIRIITRATQCGGNAGTAVGVKDGCIEGELTGFALFSLDITGPGGHGDQAAAFQLGQGATLG